MGCNCGAAKPTDAHSLRLPGEKVTVFCQDCEGGLVAINGMTYPVHATLVTIPKTQYEAWVEQGYHVEIANEN